MLQHIYAVCNSTSTAAVGIFISISLMYSVNWNNTSHVYMNASWNVSLKQLHPHVIFVWSTNFVGGYLRNACRQPDSPTFTLGQKVAYLLFVAQMKISFPSADSGRPDRFDVNYFVFKAARNPNTYPALSLPPPPGKLKPCRDVPGSENDLCLQEIGLIKMRGWHRNTVYWQPGWWTSRPRPDHPMKNEVALRWKIRPMFFQIGDL